jgi:hypothetical protein
MASSFAFNFSFRTALLCLFWGSEELEIRLSCDFVRR